MKGKYLDGYNLIALEDLDRDEPYEDGSYTWDSFLTDAPTPMVKEVVDRVLKDYKLDLDYGDELEHKTNKVMEELIVFGFEVIESPYPTHFPIKGAE